MPNPLSDWTCYMCDRQFSRNEHLRRHLSGHSNIASYQCLQCGRCFKRKDALGRHRTTCAAAKGIKTRNTDIGRLRLPPRTSLPNCPDLISQPNEDDHGVYRFETLAECHTSHFGVLDLPQYEEMPVSNSIQNDEATAAVSNSIQNDEATAAVLPIEGDWDSCRKKSLLELRLCQLPSLANVHTPPTTSFEFLIHFTSGYDLQSCFRFGRSDWSRVSQSDLTLIRPISHDRRHPELHQKSLSIISAIRSSSSSWSGAIEKSCKRFFDPENLERFLALYWTEWYPNWPVIHKPSFDILKGSTPLLSAMVVTGACHAPLQPDREDAQNWFDSVERFIFQNLQARPENESTADKIDKIQAAFLVCIYQTWQGAPAARQRIRRSQFGILANATRDLDMSQLRHSDLSIFEDFRWSAFIRTEQQIRTVLWVFCLDTAFTIFNSMPPRFVLRELRLGLASCELAFQAKTAEDCFTVLEDWQRHSPRPPGRSLYGLINIFSKPNLEPDLLDNLAHESFVNLWCVISAFHVLLYNLDPILGSKEQFQTLRRTLCNVEHVWQQRLRNNDEMYFDSIVVAKPTDDLVAGDRSDWRRPGFWRNAAEYWLLARLLLDSMESAWQGSEAADELSGLTGLHREVTGHSNDRIDDDSMPSLHEFLINARIFL